MNISKYLTVIGAFAKENAPAILQGASLAAGGLALAAGIAGQHKADEVIADLPEDDQKDFSKCLKITWKYYVPAGVLYAASVACGVSSYKTEATRVKALVSAAALTSDKTDGLIETAKDKLGIESKDDKEKQQNDKNTEHRVVFTEQTHWIYEPVSGLYFRTTPSEIYGACIKCAEDWNEKEHVSIGDIIRNVDDLAFDVDVPHSADFFGWDTKEDSAECMIPYFKNGYVRPDGTPALKLEFLGEVKPIADKWIE